MKRMLSRDDLRERFLFVEFLKGASDLENNIFLKAVNRCIGAYCERNCSIPLEDLCRQLADFFQTNDSFITMELDL